MVDDGDVLFGPGGVGGLAGGFGEGWDVFGFFVGVALAAFFFGYELLLLVDEWFLVLVLNFGFWEGTGV